MNSFQKLDFIEKKYKTRKYNKNDLATSLDMTQADLTNALHLKNIHYGIQRTPNNLPANKLYNIVLCERHLKFLEKYNFESNKTIKSPTKLHDKP
ncbi:hypothetical protein DWV13_05545 [Clostridium botulinum]|uniref:hypothetical protein n=1 Tax=Clostridium TaxID=1485 RepID=UPI0013F6A9C0|nr:MULTISPECIES: hypothetical protein [Clostridium]MCS6131109.1 hypothetical protein [Clostridium botulinum]NFL46893.1 hypothetical protein [Clostridium botulinum]NFL91049.1 hypothetical protein [Clostridium botulinum]